MSYCRLPCGFCGAYATVTCASSWEKLVRFPTRPRCAWSRWRSASSFSCPSCRVLRLRQRSLRVSIAVSAWYGGAGPGVLALILSAAAIDYLVVVPGTFLHFTNIGEAVLFACYIAAWLGFCLLTERTYRVLRRDRNLRRMAEQTARQSDRVAQLTAALGQARTPGSGDRSRRAGAAARAGSGSRRHGADAERRRNGRDRPRRGTAPGRHRSSRRSACQTRARSLMPSAAAPRSSSNRERRSSSEYRGLERRRSACATTRSRRFRS